MHRSTFVTVGLLTFGLILATFIVRGSTRLVIGDRLSLLLALPLAALSLILLAILLVTAALDLTRIKRMDDDLSDSSVD